MLVTTTNEIPGWQIQRVIGEVFGLTVRSRNAFSQMGAGLKSIFGGELQGMTKNLAESRNEVMNRMLEAARARGGNAVICMRFDTSDMADTWTELCAYGTAVVAVPIDEELARPQLNSGTVSQRASRLRESTVFPITLRSAGSADPYDRPICRS